MEAHFYKTEIKWEKDRVGMMSSPDLKLQFEVATPPQFPKGIEGIWSPEHLLTAAVGSCFMTTFLAIAENSKLDFSGFSCEATGKLEQVEGKLLISEVLLHPTLTIINASEKEKAMRVLQKSEAGCLISNSIKAKISMYPEINIK
ncbi:MAG: OsmC family protein [Bacteroidia bacterium]